MDIFEKFNINRKTLNDVIEESEKQLVEKHSVEKQEVTATSVASADGEVAIAKPEKAKKTTKGKLVNSNENVESPKGDPELWAIATKKRADVLQDLQKCENEISRLTEHVKKWKTELTRLDAYLK
jgi:hypothetical protein